MKKLVLYSTAGCHLCELAMEVIAPVLGEAYQLEEVDISESDQLMARYGIRIPVVKRADTEAEIGWPFDQSQFIAFLN